MKRRKKGKAAQGCANGTAYFRTLSTTRVADETLRSLAGYRLKTGKEKFIFMRIGHVVPDTTFLPSGSSIIFAPPRNLSAT
jgi:hypothetical protein